MNKYSGWEDYYRSNKSQSIWKEEIEPFLIENSKTILSSKSGLKVLDIACGDGRNTAFFCHKNNIVCCVDISETALEKLGNKYTETIRICDDFNKIYLANEQFDIVMCFDGLAQMDNPQSVLCKMIEMTKKNGLIIFNFFTPNDCAYGEGKQINENTFNYKDTLFKFYSFDQMKRMIPSNVKIIKEEVRLWNDPPHGEFRPYPHQHEASYFILKRYL